MADFTLVIGNRNYSSWSLRGWLTAKIAGIEFDEVVIPLDRPETQAAIAEHSPSGRVPVLLHDGLAVWESLAIAEYLNDIRPEAGIWPAAPKARAVARAISAEMHAGFAELRTHMPMDIRAVRPGRDMTPEVRADIDRIVALWRDCRRRFAKTAAKDDGFLFGTIGAADAMYAPVVTRFRTYGVALDPDADAYCKAVLAHPAMKDWIEAAKREPWSIAQ
ncbi:glutathione S-transferase family protein [Enhydrobacter sp.]|uniref:glutathione S-transferase family protein n=1 Tax=Enhydrobacter sp. TaxID=1894999 RepID=UPI00260A6CB8|nr:glutathione S-transferase family protein [Enhydrobacter sp.]